MTSLRGGHRYTVLPLRRGYRYAEDIVTRRTSLRGGHRYTGRSLRRGYRYAEDNVTRRTSYVEDVVMLCNVKIAQPQAIRMISTLHIPTLFISLRFDRFERSRSLSR